MVPSRVLVTEYESSKENSINREGRLGSKAGSDVPIVGSYQKDESLVDKIVSSIEAELTRASIGFERDAA